MAAEAAAIEAKKADDRAARFKEAKEKDGWKGVAKVRSETRGREERRKGVDCFSY